jgi:hypothetical protein
VTKSLSPPHVIIIVHFCLWGTPAARAILQNVSGSFAAPAAGFYALGVAVSGSVAAGSSLVVRGELQMHQA